MLVFQREVIHVIYYGNGTKCEIDNATTEKTEFYIKDLGDGYPDRFIYQDDSLNYELDGELVVLYDKLRDLIFNDTEKYYMESYNIPIFINEAGLNSDCRLSADSFAKLIQNDKSDMIPNFNKHLYLADCQFLVGNIQNLLCGIEDAFINYFVNISNINSIHYMDNPNTTTYVMSQSVRAISSILESYFIKTYSILDMVVKIAFEMQNPQDFFSEYPKMKSNKLLWGDKKKLAVAGYKETLFESCDIVSIIESMRNEVVHNGSWELNPKVFMRFEEAQLVERYMLFPDISQGRLAKVKSRKHFFGDEIKVNDILPKIHKNFLQRLLNTIKLLNNYPADN